jgi:hypothetical protein
VNTPVVAALAAEQAYAARSCPQFKLTVIDAEHVSRKEANATITTVNTNCFGQCNR